jgi:hypothetical protein
MAYLTGYDGLSDEFHPNRYIDQGYVDEDADVMGSVSSHYVGDNRYWISLDVGLILATPISTY